MSFKFKIIFPSTNVERRVDRDRVSKQISIWDHYSPSIIGLNDGGPSLNLFHRAFVIVHLDLIAQPKRFGPKQQQAGKEILQYVLKSETNCHAADAEDLYQIGSLERRGHNRKGDQEAKQNGCCSGEAGEHDTQAWAVFTSSTMDHAAHQAAEPVKEEENNNAQNQRWKPRKKTVAHVMSGVPKLREV